MELGSRRKLREGAWGCAPRRLESWKPQCLYLYRIILILLVTMELNK